MAGRRSGPRKSSRPVKPIEDWAGLANEAKRSSDAGVASIGACAESSFAPFEPTNASCVGTLLEDVFATLGIGVVVFNHNLEVTAGNTAAGELLSENSDVIRRLESAEFESAPGSWREVLLGVLESGQPRHFDSLCSRGAQVSPRFLKIVVAPLGGAGAEGGLLTIEDVSARVCVEQRLAASERLAALGQLAARVAHELNNPLDGILRYVGLALRSAEEAGFDKSVQYLDQARTGLLRMAQILRSLLEYSRGNAGGPREATLAGLVEEAIRSFEEQASAVGVSVVCSFDQPNLQLGQASGLFQVFCNLIKNAVEAMPSGGTLTVKARTCGGRQEISFEDTGRGLPTDTNRLFEPFFTTKAPGRGTGLGLAVCKEIVEKSGGRIYAETGARGGARFVIELPMRAERTFSGH